MACVVAKGQGRDVPKAEGSCRGGRAIVSLVAGTRRGAVTANGPHGWASHCQVENWPTQGQAREETQPVIQAHGWDRHAGTWQKAHPGQSYGDPGQKIHWDAPGKADLGHADWFPHRATTVSHLCGGRDLMSCNFLHKVMCIHLLGMLWLPILVLDKEL